MGQPIAGCPKPYFGGEHMYEKITCTNDPAGAGIKISVEWDGTDIANVSTFALRRRLSTDDEYTVLKTGWVMVGENLTYTYYDIEPVAGISYTYDACVFNENGLRLGGATQDIRCTFSGILVADSVASWYSAFGTSETRFGMTAQKNRPVNYVVTLSGKFPHRVSNSQANYWTGSCTALWLPMGVVCGEASMDSADEYRLAFMEWLTTDTEKYLKTGDGKAMMVSIDGTPSESYSALAGMTTVTFDWTQTGEALRPPFDVDPVEPTDPVATVDETKAYLGI